jgi:hypothetical protein
MGPVCIPADRVLRHHAARPNAHNREHTQREMEPGSLRGLQLVVADAAAARQELIGRGVEASELVSFGDQDGSTFFGFADPDGNTWAVQELKVRATKPLIPPEARGRFGA